MRDELVRAITADGLVKAVAITGLDLVERARQIHTLLPVATAALGRSLLGASMLGDMLKEDGASLTLQIKGGGPLGTVLAVSDNQGNLAQVWGCARGFSPRLIDEWFYALDEIGIDIPAPDWERCKNLTEKEYA